jgi:hypothetical protein
VERAQLDTFLKEADTAYRAQSAYTPQFLVCESVEGASVMPST